MLLNNFIKLLNNVWINVYLINIKLLVIIKNINKILHIILENMDLVYQWNIKINIYMYQQKKNFNKFNYKKLLN